MKCAVCGIHVDYLIWCPYIRNCLVHGLAYDVISHADKEVFHL